MRHVMRAQRLGRRRGRDGRGRHDNRSRNRRRRRGQNCRRHWRKLGCARSRNSGWDDSCRQGNRRLGLQFESGRSIGSRPGHRRRCDRRLTRRFLYRRHHSDRRQRERRRFDGRRCNRGGGSGWHRRHGQRLGRLSRLWIDGKTRLQSHFQLGGGNPAGVFPRRRRRERCRNGWYGRRGGEGRGATLCPGATAGRFGRRCDGCRRRARWCRLVAHTQARLQAQGRRLGLVAHTVS